MDEQFITKDLGEACTLITSGCPMSSIQWKDQTAYFCFSNKKACEEISKEYFFGNAQVAARSFYENLRMLKRKLGINNYQRGR